MKYQLCIFDLDGTLADTVESMSYSANLTLRELGLKEQPSDSFKYFAGDGVYELTKRCLAASGDGEGRYFDRFLSIYREYFAKYCMHQVRPYDGICELLEGLKERGVMRAVLSNKPHQQAVDVIRALFGEGDFDFVQGQQEGIPRKPDPAGALHIAKTAGISPNKCLYIGDTNTDMQTGNRAGMNTVGVLWGFRDRKELEDNQACHIVSRPEEILLLLEQNAHGGMYD